MPKGKQGNSEKGVTGSPVEGKPRNLVANPEAAMRAQLVRDLKLPRDLYRKGHEDGASYAAAVKAYMDSGDMGAYQRLVDAKRVLDSDAYKGLDTFGALRLHAIERAIADAPVEHGAIVVTSPKFGRVLENVRTDNDAKQVWLPNKYSMEAAIPTAKLPARGGDGIATHNHPGGLTFSTQDLLGVAANWWGVDEMRAVGRYNGRTVVHRVVPASGLASASLRYAFATRISKLPEGDARHEVLNAEIRKVVSKSPGKYSSWQEAAFDASVRLGRKAGLKVTRHFLD